MRHGSAYSFNMYDDSSPTFPQGGGDSADSMATRHDGESHGGNELPPWARRALSAILVLGVLWGVGLVSSACLVAHAKERWWNSHVEWEQAVEHSLELQNISFGACEIRPKVSERDYGYGPPDSYQVTIWGNIRSVKRIDESRRSMDAETTRHKAYSKVMFDRLGTPEDVRRAECSESGQP